MAVNYPACSTLTHNDDGYPALDLFFGDAQKGRTAKESAHDN
jgi:hypothetical protein